MPVDAKVFLIVLRSAVEPYVSQAVVDCAQYAYRPQAGTADALLRASHHCQEVRALVAAHQQDYTAKILGQTVPDLSGGLMCNLDLAKAFDAVSHLELYESMIEVGVPDSLARLILHVHALSTCVIVCTGRSARLRR